MNYSNTFASPIHTQSNAMSKVLYSNSQLSESVIEKKLPHGPISLNYTSDSEPVSGGSVSSPMIASGSSSSVSSVPSFRFDTSQIERSSGSTPGTSPTMSRSYSSSSSTSEFAMKGLDDLEYEQHKNKFSDDGVEFFGTSPHQPMIEIETSALEGPMESYSPTGNGKHGMDVWPPEVEESFFKGS